MSVTKITGAGYYENLRMRLQQFISSTQVHCANALTNDTASANHFSFHFSGNSFFHSISKSKGDALLTNHHIAFAIPNVVILRALAVNLIMKHLFSLKLKQSHEMFSQESAYEVIFLNEFISYLHFVPIKMTNDTFKNDPKGSNEAGKALTSATFLIDFNTVFWHKYGRPYPFELSTSHTNRPKFTLHHYKLFRNGCDCWVVCSTDFYFLLKFLTYSKQDSNKRSMYNIVN